MELHDLTAAYALDALDPEERREFEWHLLGCEQCRDELVNLQDAAGALAFAVEAPPPPSALRARILEQARGERPNVVPLRRRRPFQAAVGVATLAAAAAVAVAFWATSVTDDLARERSATAQLRDVLADPNTKRVSVVGGRGNLIVSGSRTAALVLENVERAPAGKTYEVWVMENGRPTAAGLFDADRGHALVVLDEPVPPGATVAVTIEPDGGSLRPLGPRIYTVPTV